MTRGLRIVAFCLFTISVGLCHAADAQAQAFPDKPIRFIVANSPAVGPDIVARLMGPAMSKYLGQSIVVENRPGAGTVLGYEYVAKQVPPDGYTLALVQVPDLQTLPLLTKNLPFDPLKDLPPIAGIAEVRLV